MPTRIKLFGDTQRANQYRFQAYRKHLADALMLRGFQNLPIYRHQARLPEGGMVDIVCHHNFNEISIYMPPRPQPEEEREEFRQQYLFSASAQFVTEDESIHQIIPDGLIKTGESPFTGDFEHMIFGRDNFLYASISNRAKKIDPSSMAEIAEFYCGDAETLDGAYYGGIPPCLTMGKDLFLYTGAQRIDNNNSVVHKVDPSNMEIIGKYESDNGRVESVDFGNKYLYVGLFDGYVHKVDPSDMLGIRSTAQSGAVAAVIIGNDGFLYVGTQDSFVHKYDPTDMSYIDSYDGHTDSVLALAMNEEGKLFSAGEDFEIHKIDPSSMSVIDKYTKHSGTVYDLIVDQDNYLYSAASDTQVHRIESSTLNQNDVYDKHNAAVQAVAITNYPVEQ